MEERVATLGRVGVGARERVGMGERRVEAPRVRRDYLEIGEDVIERVAQAGSERRSESIDAVGDRRIPQRGAPRSPRL